MNRGFYGVTAYLAGAGRAVENFGVVVSVLVRPLLFCARMDAGVLCSTCSRGRGERPNEGRGVQTDEPRAKTQEGGTIENQP